MTEATIPDYEKVTLINSYLETIKKLEGQIEDAQKRYTDSKKQIENKLETDFKRIEYQIKKEKDSTITQKEITSYRKKENKQYEEISSQMKSTIDDFLQSKEYMQFVVEFYNSHKESIVDVVSPATIAKDLGLSDFTLSESELVFITKDVNYDFSKAVVSNIVAKYLLTH